MARYLFSVSYTHLDVYKRQAAVCAVQLYSSAQYGNAMVQRLSVGLAQQIVAREPLLDAPVSYTHLDVYKRQWRMGASW